MSRSEPLRVAILATHPIQYQVPLWRKLAASGEFDVHVFYGSDISVRGYRDEGFGVNVSWDVPLTEGYAHTFLSLDASLQRVSFWYPRAVKLQERLRDFRPQVVLHTAYNSLFWIEALRVARSLDVPVVMRHEASDEAVSRSALKSFMRDQGLRYLYSHVRQFAAIGINARKHLQRLGIPSGKIGWSPYCVDSDLMEQQVIKWRHQRAALRTQLKIKAEDYALIFAGKLTAKKQPLLIISAIESLPPMIRERIHLIVLGDGELRAPLEVKGSKVLGGRLHMAGFVNQTGMGHWYAAADCLVLPSSKGAGETWGLVVNEALQFGLPAIVSDGVGCRSDLIDINVGRVFNSDSATDFARAVTEVLLDVLRNRDSCNELCRQKVSHYSLTAAADGLAAALNKAAKAALLTH